MKTEKEIKDFFEKVEAIQNGHFILSSGKRSKIYCQCSKLFEAVSYTHLPSPRDS